MWLTCHDLPSSVILRPQCCVLSPGGAFGGLRGDRRLSRGVPGPGPSCPSVTYPPSCPPPCGAAVRGCSIHPSPSCPAARRGRQVVVRPHHHFQPQRLSSIRGIVGIRPCLGSQFIDAIAGPAIPAHLARLGARSRQCKTRQVVAGLRPVPPYGPEGPTSCVHHALQPAKPTETRASATNTGPRHGPAFNS
jgi:hypothetical protein